MHWNATITSTSRNDATDQWPRTVPIPMDPIYASAELLCAILSIGGNAAVLLVYIRTRSLRVTVRNAYVASLACADLLVGLVGIPSALATSVGLPRHFEACLVMNSILLGLCTASIASLVGVTVDRLWAIVFPLQYHVTMTSRRARYVIGGCWTLAAVTGLLPVLGWNAGSPPIPRCFFAEVMDGRYLILIFIGTIITPSVFIFVVYVIIYRTVTKQGLVMQQFQNEGGEDEQRRQQEQQMTTESRAARNIAVIIIVFVISWLPLYALNTAAWICSTNTPKFSISSSSSSSPSSFHAISSHSHSPSSSTSSFHTLYSPQSSLRSGSHGFSSSPPTSLIFPSFHSAHSASPSPSPHSLSSFSCSGWIPPVAFQIAIILSHYNSVWNPLLYAWGMKDIRKALKETFLPESANETDSLITKNTKQ